MQMNQAQKPVFSRILSELPSVKSLSSIWRLGLVASLCIGAAGLVRCSRGPHTYVSLSEPVAYVGSEACQPCHEKISKSFQETGMGKSLYRPSRGQMIERFGESERVYDPQLDFYYLAFWKGEEMFMIEYRLDGNDTLHRRLEKVDYVVGSGHQTRSYLMERSGWIYEMPLTWYVEKKIWDLSPGYDMYNARFDREIGEACMACHTGHIDFIPYSKNRYRKISLGIDCESCHGPGQAHVEAIEGGQLIDVGKEIDYTIVNPDKLPLEAQFDVCQQCHLQGLNVYAPGKGATDFRPGQALEKAWTVFLADSGHSEQFGIASHAERLRQSRCFIASEGTLTCTTCHDPHTSLEAEDPMIYRHQCESCHKTAQDLRCTVSPAEAMEGDCISCHMPSGGTSDIPHVSFHDHNIRVVRSEKTELGEVMDYLRLLPAHGGDVASDTRGKAWLAYFEEQSREPAFLDSALALLSPENHGDLGRQYVLRGKMPEAQKEVDLALTQDPQRPEWLFLKGEILESTQQHAAAFALFAHLHETHPGMFEAAFRREINRYLAKPEDPATLEASAQGFERLIAERPFDKRLFTNLGFLRLQQNRLSEAERWLVQALLIDPDDVKALENMILLHSLRGNAQLAQIYFRRLERAHPDHAALERIRSSLQGSPRLR